MALSNFINNFVNPSNPLGQLGQAMLAASGGPIGGTFQNLIQQRQFMMQHALQQQYQQARIDLDERRARAPISHVVGADVINEDPMTGAEINRIHGTLAPTDLERYMIGAGIDPHSPEGMSLYRQAAENRADPLQGVPITNPDGSHGITFYRRGDIAGMAGGSPGAPPPPQPGEVRGNFRFRGGDPANPSSWEQRGQGSSPPPGGPVRTSASGFSSFRSPAYDAIEGPIEQQYGLPQGLLSAIRTRGERSNADQVSPAGAQTVYQVIPSTRAGVIRNYGVDAYAGPTDAARAAALVLREGYQRTGSWNGAITNYIGGPNPSRWGPQTRAYVQRVGSF